MTCEEFKLLTDGRDFVSLFYNILRQESSEWLKLSFKSDLGTGVR